MILFVKKILLSLRTLIKAKQSTQNKILNSNNKGLQPLAVTLESTQWARQRRPVGKATLLLILFASLFLITRGFRSASLWETPCVLLKFCVLLNFYTMGSPKASFRKNRLVVKEVNKFLLDYGLCPRNDGLFSVIASETKKRRNKKRMPEDIPF